MRTRGGNAVEDQNAPDGYDALQEHKMLQKKQKTPIEMEMDLALDLALWIRMMTMEIEHSYHQKKITLSHKNKEIGTIMICT